LKVEIGYAVDGMDDLMMVTILLLLMVALM